MKNWLLQKKLNLILIAAFLICSTLISIIHISFQTQRIETVTNKIYLLLKTLVEGERKALANEIFEERLEAIELRIEKISSVEGVTRVVVFKENGSILYQFNTNKQTDKKKALNSKLVSKINKKIQIKIEKLNNVDVLAYYQKISAIGEILGYIKICYSLEDVHTERNISIIILLIQLLILFFVLFIIIKIFISHSIIKPLKTLENTISKLNIGKLNANVTVTSNDEIGNLSSTFNKMSNDLYKAQNYISNIINSMPSILISIDEKNRITHWNMTAEKITGIKDADAKGKTLINVYPQLKPELEIIKSSIKNKEIKHDLKKSRETKSGIVYENLVIYPLVTNGVEGAVIRIDDVTKEHTLETQLNQVHKMEAIGQLAGGVAHDFNNMLAGITSAAQLLKSPKRNLDEKGKEYVNMILLSVTRAAELISKLLSFARKGKVISNAVDIHKIIDDTVAIFKRTIDKKITITIDKNAKTHNVIGDNSELQNCLMNLGINSSNAMPDGGELQIETRNIHLNKIYCDTSPFELTPGKYIEIYVRDNGYGIRKENLSKIFDPFFTTKNEKNQKGTGLGLAAVYGTVQDHHGSISVYSEVGTGTVFQIMLPCTEEIAKNEDKENLILTGSGLILLVDDEELIRITSKAMLEEMGYEVILAMNGREALEIFKVKHAEIDLVIMDMIMPTMSGSETFLQMKEIDNECKVVIASGFSKDKNIEDLKKIGLKGFIRKPYHDYELSKILSNLLNS